MSENKTLAGKELKPNEGEAVGRKLAVAFFTREGGSFTHIGDDGPSLTLQLLSIAEILQALGVELPADPLRTSAAAELQLEEHCHHIQIFRQPCTWERGPRQQRGGW